ncbi:hypothetical protein ATS75_17890 [Pseudoalteromonas sp. H105]|jgi:hypothetical protein|nr:hypothetical protein ATS75_17890 [Pseudoalteromonas sp. H105]
MYINDVIGPYIGVFIEWGFLMAFLFKLVSRLNNPDKSAVQLSFIMAFSYLLSGTFSFSYSTYLNWFIYDLITIGVIALWFLYVKKRRFITLVYILIGLSLNALLMITTHYDIYVRHNNEHWFLWTVYSYGVNIIDLLMITALATEKDFFLLRKVLNRFGSRHSYNIQKYPLDN